MTEKDGPGMVRHTVCDHPHAVYEERDNVWSCDLCASVFPADDVTRG